MDCTLARLNLIKRTSNEWKQKRHRKNIMIIEVFPRSIYTLSFLGQFQ